MDPHTQVQRRGFTNLVGSETCGDESGDWDQASVQGFIVEKVVGTASLRCTSRAFRALRPLLARQLVHRSGGFRRDRRDTPNI